MQKEVSCIRKSLISGGEISLAVLDTTALVNEAIRRHGLSPVAAAALGRTMTATAYLCSWLKEGSSSLSVSIDGKGAGGKIGVSGDGNLHMRGFIGRPDVDLPPRADGKLDVGTCVGRDGTLTVIRDDGTGVPFVGTCPLVSGEIAEDFSAYFFTSEQLPTAVALGVKIGTDGTCLAAGGVCLQPLPGAGEESLDEAERLIGGFSDLSSQIEAEGAEAIFRRLGGTGCDRREILFRCHCSREKTQRLILSLGREEAESILRDEGSIRVHCHYCNTEYVFGEHEIAELFRGGERL